MRILVLEDDAALSVYLQRGLQMQGHEVRAAGDGTTGLQLALAGAYDLVVLDLSLPCMDGVEVLREMRRNALEVSVLVLTGRAGIHDRVQCLDLGADDYLLKPFSFSELTARCRSLMRRRERFADPVLRQGDLELHRMERKVLRKGRLVELTVKEFALLEYLMMAHGRVCTRSELLREVWQMSPDAGTNVVDVYVNYLRKKLGAVKVSPCGPGMEPEMAIETVRGEGYFLASGRKLVRSVGAGDTAGLAPVVGGPVGGLQFALGARARA